MFLVDLHAEHFDGLFRRPFFMADHTILRAQLGLGILSFLISARGFI
jgi:hypothetical protein